MVKRASGLVFLVLTGFLACVTYTPPPPNFYIGEIPADITAQLSLDERIQAEEAWRSLREGNFRKAEKILSRIGIVSPVYYSGQGYVAYLQGDLAGAEQYFRASVEDHPDLQLGHLGLAQIYQETGRDDQAFSEYREVLKSEPQHPWARPRYERIREAKTDEALYDARTLTAGEDIEGGKSAYLRALYYSPSLTEAHTALARIYTSLGQARDALVHLKAASENEPENPEILMQYGETLESTEEYAPALEMYERVLEIDPDSSAAGQRIENLKNRLGIFELPSQYDVIPDAAAVTKEQMAALLGVKFKTALDSPSGKPPIIIDISTSWAARFILKTAALGILDVYPNHTFQPEKPLNRAETAEILFRLIERLSRTGHRFIQHLPPERIQIGDVSANHFYYRPIIMMISFDIMSLSPGRMFNPDRAVSGREAIRLLDIILAQID